VLVLVGEVLVTVADEEDPELADRVGGEVDVVVSVSEDDEADDEEELSRMGEADVIFSTLGVAISCTAVLEGIELLVVEGEETELLELGLAATVRLTIP